MIRPSPYIYTLHRYSVTRESGNSLGSQPKPHGPGVYPNLHRIVYLHTSPTQIGHWATVTSFFRYTQISLPQGQVHCLVFPFLCWMPFQRKLWIISTQWTSIIAPGSSVRFDASNSATYPCRWRFPPSLNSSRKLDSLCTQVSLKHGLDFQVASKHRRALFIELIAGMILIWSVYVFCFFCC